MSAFPRSVLVLVLGVVLVSASLGAQRGGGGGRASGGFERPETPMAFDSEELKIHIDAPEHSMMYTSAIPGRYKSALVNGKFLHVDSTDYRHVAVEAKSLPKMTDADLKAFADTLGTNPPQAKLPGFKKLGLKTIKIGKERDKEAVEFVYNAEQNGTPMTFRLVAFVHGNNGFVFTCSSLEAESGAAETLVLMPLVFRMEFR
jgi:hypothetical protein